MFVWEADLIRNKMTWATNAAKVCGMTRQFYPKKFSWHGRSSIPMIGTAWAGNSARRSDRGGSFRGRVSRPRQRRVEYILAGASHFSSSTKRAIVSVL